MAIQLPFTVKWKREDDTVTLAKFHHADDADLFAFITAKQRAITVTVHEGNCFRRMVTAEYARSREAQMAIDKLSSSYPS